MKEQIVDEEIRLIPYYRNDEASLPWYQDADVCKQVDDRDTPYDLELLHRMYDYLCTHGDCYYIEYCGTLVGDISLRDCCLQGISEPAYWAAVRSGADEAGKGEGHGAGHGQHLCLQHAEPADVPVGWICADG